MNPHPTFASGGFRLRGCGKLEEPRTEPSDEDRRKFQGTCQKWVVCLFDTTCGKPCGKGIRFGREPTQRRGKERFALFQGVRSHSPRASSAQTHLRVPNLEYRKAARACPLPGTRAGRGPRWASAGCPCQKLHRRQHLARSSRIACHQSVGALRGVHQAVRPSARRSGCWGARRRD